MYGMAFAPTLASVKISELLDSNFNSLLEASGRKVSPLGNVPNRYLRPKSRG